MFYVCFNTNIVLCKSFYHKVVIIIQGKCAEIADRLDTLRINPTKNTANDYIEIGAVKLNDKLEQIDTFSKFVKPVINRELRKKISRYYDLC
jgi:hypothetical protein